MLLTKAKEGQLLSFHLSRSPGLKQKKRQCLLDVCMFGRLDRLRGWGRERKNVGVLPVLCRLSFFFFFKIDTLILFSKELKGKVFIMNYHSVQDPSDAIAKSMVKRWPKISCILF